MANENQNTENQNQSSVRQDKNAEMAKSKDKSLKTKFEGDPDGSVEPGVGGFSTGGSSDGTGSA
jgi:hypothetical protein